MDIKKHVGWISCRYVSKEILEQLEIALKIYKEI